MEMRDAGGGGRPDFHGGYQWPCHHLVLDRGQRTRQIWHQQDCSVGVIMPPYKAWASVPLADINILRVIYPSPERAG